MERQAIILVDFLNDFVTGALGCDRAKALLAPTARLIGAAREHGIPIVYANDAHYPEIDREFEIWGSHAVIGTKGAEVVPELAPTSRDYVIPKHRYSGFFQTNMHLLLTELGVDTCVVTGLHTHMCVRHTSADAFCYGYHIVVPKDATDAFTEEDYRDGLKYLREVYGAEITDVDTLIQSWG